MIKTSTQLRRTIPDDFSYNPKKLKHLKHVLHNVSVALGTLTSALNEFSRMKGPDISPDGMLGGVGYIIPIKDIKQSLNTSIHELSNVADCIADEMTNPRWNIVDDKGVKKLIEEKEEATEEVEKMTDEGVMLPEEDDSISPNDVISPHVEEVTVKEASNKNDVLASAILNKIRAEK